LEPLIERSAISEIELLDARFFRDRVSERIARNEHGLAEAKRQLALAIERLESFPTRISPEFARLIAPVKAKIGAQEVVIDGVKLRIEGLDIRAPFSGTIAAIYQWPGQNVSAGTPIVSLAADQGRYVVGYIRDEMKFRPEAGMKIAIRTRSEQPRTYLTYVDRVGPQVELIPEHQQRNPRWTEWGLPVRIALPPTAPLKPGELVDVRFER
jgi:hypothetical protein